LSCPWLKQVTKLKGLKFRDLLHAVDHTRCNFSAPRYFVNSWEFLSRGNWRRNSESVIIKRDWRRQYWGLLNEEGFIWPCSKFRNKITRSLDTLWVQTFSVHFSEICLYIASNFLWFVRKYVCPVFLSQRSRCTGSTCLPLLRIRF
jgi:hypothetical protein